MLKKLFMYICFALISALLFEKECFAQELQENTTILYYSKRADGNSVLNAVKQFTFPNSGLIVVPANPYYDNHNLPTNALLCGMKAPKEYVREAFRQLIGAGVKIMQVGPYYNPEINSA